jgi:hypothetical protein
MTGREGQKLLSEMAAKLGEHFEAVQILGTWSEDGHTYSCKEGSGNWYARQGMAHEFIQEEIADDTAAKLAEQLKPEDE